MRETAEQRLQSIAGARRALPVAAPLRPLGHLTHGGASNRAPKYWRRCHCGPLVGAAGGARHSLRRALNDEPETP